MGSGDSEVEGLFDVSNFAIWGDFGVNFSKI